jgi:hypothetical protein
MHHVIPEVHQPVTGKQAMHTENINTQTTETTQNTSEIEPSSKGSLLNDHQVNALALAFLEAEKPKGITPPDVLLVTKLIHRRAFDHPINDSQHTLAKSMGCDIRTVARSLERLTSPSINWVARSKRQGYSDGLTLLHDNLPLAEKDKLQITAAAKKLAGKYHEALTKRGHKKRPKGWLSQQFVSAQRILNDCGGDFRLACAIISHALGTPAHKVSSRKSLYHICVRWKHIGATFAAEQAAAEQATQEMAPQTEVVN